mmetsp:Transcript_2326/g.6774  ORF Transcript_2326/g.6774 Transcript_2326/m.6774 type:complete len:498 (-) Transcript_2326:45-1538(-)|eukprot:CAMPEP_0181021464 /NCGR_PEP_ID=MMETSP1070-20121207/995_1 /TAXON_ID=265543 /ORGANISM="Minutocellus polymorphus, Strain NH13" /LENGTH=497 /DNA_ID=CAMNT_0023098341 /DNA_START=27 /DNA_END=1520 /DNA_ORIENTATION=+
MTITDEEIAAVEAQVAPLPPSELSQIQPLLQAFCIRHQSHHRPIALVTSGGTATDLEVNSVRFLDNFSTGLRGAVSAEQFLRRGYAVIHLWREGSAAPYTRTLSAALGTKQANHGLGFDALGRMFDFPGEERQQDEEERMVNQVRSNDPWLTDTSGRKDVYHDGTSTTAAGGAEGGSASDSSQGMLDSKDGSIALNRRLFASSEIETALRERAEVVKQGLLLTVKFRTVDEYLAKLQLCSKALHDSQSLGVIYLAAAVSDFYIPKAKRSLHKIQSQDYGTGGSESTVAVDADNCLTLKLHPVPKLIPALRKHWAPDAFTVSFKLETDTSILRHKAMLAMKRYGPHLVVGNILKTRHEKVWILQQTNNDTDDNQGSQDDPSSVIERGFEMKEISKKGKCGGGIDELEDAMIGHIVEKHFEYVANHIAEEGEGGGRTALMAGAEAAALHNRRLAEKKARLQSELYWKRVKDMSLTLAGHALGMLLTWSLSTALQARLRR